MAGVVYFTKKELYELRAFAEEIDRKPMTDEDWEISRLVADLLRAVIREDPEYQEQRFLRKSEKDAIRRIRRHERYLIHKEEIISREKARYRANKRDCVERAKRRYQLHREEIIEYQKERYRKRKEKEQESDV